MKYETPELTVLTPAINAIQQGKSIKVVPDSGHLEVPTASYEDWE
jgi:hypothetical protein